MHKQLVIALLAPLAFAVLSTATLAQSRQREVVPNNPDNPVECAALCGNIPPVDPVSALDKSYQVCGDRLAQLRRVTPREVRAIDPQKVVRLIPVCDSLLKTLTAVQVNLADRGNAGGLLSEIARNRTLVAALGQHRYVPDDVVGIVVAPTFTALYVHKQ